MYFLVIFMLTLFTSQVSATTNFSNDTNHNQIPRLNNGLDERSLSNPAYVLGQYWFRQLNGHQNYIEFPPAYDYLQHQVSQLLPHTSLHTKTVETAILNHSQSNAFVIPGNHLFLYSDIMHLLNTEDKLLALLAHELAHLDLNHYERQTQNSHEELNKALVMLGAGLALALTSQDKDIGTALWMGGIANQSENYLAYSRQQEQEADRLGRQYLTSAGIDTVAMNQLFLSFFKEAIGRPSIEFLSTHPLASSRVSDSLETKPTTSLLRQQPSLDFQYFRSTLLTYRAQLTDNPLAYLKQTIIDPNTLDYATALLAWLNNDTRHFALHIAHLDEDNAFEGYLKISMLMQIAEYQTAQTILDKKLQLNPTHPTYVFMHSQATTQLPTASVITGTAYYQKRLILTHLISWAEKQKDYGLALLYRAELLFEKGMEKQALNSLSRARKLIDEQDMATLITIENRIDAVISRQEQLKITTH